MNQQPDFTLKQDNLWRQKNQALLSALKNIARDLKADQSFVMSSHEADSLVLNHFPGATSVTNPRMELENENKLLMDMVSQVRADLQKASLTSPGPPDS